MLARMRWIFLFSCRRFCSGSQVRRCCWCCPTQTIKVAWIPLQKFNNYILVYHEDGNFGEYAHIRKDGSLVMPETQSAPMCHCLEGDVGFTSGPHLHFIVYLPGKKGKKMSRPFFAPRIIHRNIWWGRPYYRTKTIDKMKNPHFVPFMYL